MSRLLKIVLVIVIITVSLSGCSDRLSNMSVAQGVGIDKENSGVTVSVQYLDLTKGNSTTDNLDKNITSVQSQTVANPSRALALLSGDLSTPIFFGQNKVIVFGSEYAESELDSLVQYALRTVDSRPDVLVAISSSKAQDIMKSSENKARVPAQDVYDLLKVGERSGLTCAVNVKDLQNHYISKTADVFLPVLSVKNDKTRIDGIAVFSDNKPVKVLKNADALGFLLVNSRVKNASVVIKDSNFGLIGVELDYIRTKCRAEYRDSAVVFNCDIRFNVKINESQRDSVVRLEADDVKRIEALAEKKIKRICTDAVSKCLKEKSDPFRLGMLLARYDSDAYNSLCDDWKSNLPNVKVYVSTRAKASVVNASYTRR